MSTKIKTTELVTESSLDPNTLPSVSAVIALESAETAAETLLRFKSITDLADESIVLVLGADPVSAGLQERLKEIASPSTRRAASQVIISDLSQPVYPHLYFPDVAASYTAGRPLSTEWTTLSPSERPTIACWSYVRELGQSLASTEWSLFLREGDVLSHAEYLRCACLELASDGRSHASVPHRTPDQSRLAPLLAKNRAGVQWYGVAVPRTRGCPTVIDGSISMTSPRSRLLEEIKCHYARIRLREIDPSELDLAELASAATRLALDHDMTDLAAAATDACLAKTRNPEIESWACATKGLYDELCHQRPDRAADWYRSSIYAHPNWKSALKLARVEFARELWRECLEAYNLAIQLKSETILYYDDGPETLETSLVHVAACHDKLGHKSDARQVGQTLMSLYPNHPSVAKLAKSIG